MFINAYNPALLLNIFTAMASNITPKNFRITDIPDGPSTFSIKLMDRSVT